MPVENMTDEQLIEEVHKNGKFAVPGFNVPVDFGVGLQGKEFWHHSSTKSVSTIEDARNEIKELASLQNPVTHTIDYIGENEFYYEFRLTYAREGDQDNIAMRSIVYKESARFCAFDNAIGYYSEIRALDGDSVLRLLDLDTFFQIINWESAKVIQRDFEETDSQYIYTYYRVLITFGDWGLNDSAVAEKIKYAVDKTTGAITGYGNSTVLKTVEITGTA